MGPLTLFATGNGVLLLGLLAALIIVVWDWRVGLAMLFVEQLGVTALAVGIQNAPVQMMLVQTFVIGLCCLMLATSGIQVHMGRSGRQSGGWFFRLLVLGLLAAALASLDMRFVLPEVAPAIVRLFGWLALTALLMLSLGDHAIFTAIALLFWCILGYAVAAFYAPVAEVMVIIGLVELAVALTCSYLVLAEQLDRTPPLYARSEAPAAQIGARLGAGAPTPLTRKASPQATQVVDTVPAQPGSAPPNPSAAPTPAPDLLHPTQGGS